MKSRTLMEFTVDVAHPVGELSAVISEILGVHADSRLEILRGLDTVIGEAIVQLEQSEGTNINDGNN